MEPGEYYFVITLEMPLQGPPNAHCLTTIREVVEVEEGDTREAVTQEIVSLAIASAIEKARRDSGIELEPSGTIVFLSIEPN